VNIDLDDLMKIDLRTKKGRKIKELFIAKPDIVITYSYKPVNYPDNIVVPADCSIVGIECVPSEGYYIVKITKDGKEEILKGQIPYIKK
jgi:hypothetical protein